MRKINVAKKAKKIDLRAAGFGDEFEGAWVTVWEDPSRPVIKHLVAILVDPESVENEEDAANFFSSATRFLLDTNISGLSFETEDDVKTAFEHPDLPWLFLYKVILVSVGKVIDENEQLKKVAMRSRDPTSSGNDSENAESK